MAFDLATRQWLDPFGGLEDLAAGRLRAVSARNLAEDPLRVLRAARFLATHGLVPDPETARACRRAAPGLARVAAERIRAEWIKVLEARRAAPALRWASRVHLLRPALRVGEAAARSLARSAALFDAPALRAREPESRRRLRLALMCARLRLPPGAAAPWLAARRYGRAEAGDVAALLGLASRAREAASPRGQWSWVRDAGPLAAEALVLLRLLDPRSRSRARALSRRTARARRRGPGVSGADVLEWLRIPPGPEVGKLLAGLQIEILSGAVRTRRQARAWLASHSEAPPPL
jgi:tRNA nucleotidyltransferase (CCA-adding enzyme)